LNEPRTGRADQGKSRAAWGLLALAVIAGGFALPYFRRTHSAPAPAPESAAAPPPAVVPSEVNPWREAARLVEEDRGQAIGRAARVHVPAELRHYADKKRFLALQVAGWMEKDYPIPDDEADLAPMIDRGEMVEVPAFSKDHVLYGVGANATGEPLAHFDRAPQERLAPLGRTQDRPIGDGKAWARVMSILRAGSGVTGRGATRTVWCANRGFEEFHHLGGTPVIRVEDVPKAAISPEHGRRDPVQQGDTVGAG
jgi:DNA-binding transcriptional regulator YdaS (Cro superfamily)